jgi:hypothetical protein
VTKSVLLFVLGGFLLGGTWSLYKQEVPKAVTIVCGLLAALAIAAGVLWAL